MGISERIFELDEISNEAVPDTSEGPYFPVWQNAPVFEEIVNFNLASVDNFREGIEAISGGIRSGQMGIDPGHLQRIQALNGLHQARPLLPGRP